MFVLFAIFFVFFRCCCSFAFIVLWCAVLCCVLVGLEFGHKVTLHCPKWLNRKRADFILFRRVRHSDSCRCYFSAFYFFFLFIFDNDKENHILLAGIFYDDAILDIFIIIHKRKMVNKMHWNCFERCDAKWIFIKMHISNCFVCFVCFVAIKCDVQILGHACPGTFAQYIHCIYEFHISCTWRECAIFVL